jgi:site-specific recombinase XerD
MARAAERFLLQRETEMDVTPQTLKWYRQKLAQLERVTEVENLANLSRDHLLDFISGLRKAGRSPHYVRGWYQVFRAFIGWAREEGLAVHPSLVRDGEKWFTLKKPIQTQADTEVFTDEDLERIYEAASTQPRNVVFCQLLAGTGLRLTEALSLTLEDVQDDRLRVRQGKGRKPRWVPLSRQLRLTVDRYIERGRGEVETDRLFPNRSGAPWSRSSAEELMARIRTQTGLPVHAHAFRHTFATEYLKRGGEIDRLRRILGHETFAMTVKYAKAAGLDLSRGIDKLTPY